MRIAILLIAAVPVFAQNLETRLDSHILSYVAAGRFSGSVLVAREGKPVLSRGYGLANREWQIANTPDTRFRLGSITKQFSAVLTLMLEQQGKLSVNDPVSKYVENAPAAWQKITIHHLLSHTSGIPNFTSFPDYRSTMMLASPPQQSLKRFIDKPLDFEPGVKFSYSNSGYVLLGLILEKASGKKYDALLRELILDPAGMKGTGYDTDPAIIPRRASGYRRAGDGFLNAEFIDMTIPHAAGAMYSTVEDLLKWDQILYTDKLLPAAAREKMYTAVQGNYAYGWTVGPLGAHKRIAHGGGINGFATDIERFPEDKLTVIVLGNFVDAPSGKIGGELARIAFGETVEPFKTRSEVKIDPAVFDAYAGKYELAPNFVLTFWREGDTFWSQATNQPKVQIYPESESKFFLKVVDAQVTFVKDASGKVTGIILHQNGDRPAKRLP